MLCRGGQLLGKVNWCDTLKWHHRPACQHSCFRNDLGNVRCLYKLKWCNSKKHTDDFENDHLWDLLKWRHLLACHPRRQFDDIGNDHLFKWRHWPAHYNIKHKAAIRYRTLFYYCNMTLSQNLSQRERSFLWNLRYRWLKGLRQRLIAEVRQGPRLRLGNLTHSGLVTHTCVCKLGHYRLKNRLSPVRQVIVWSNTGILLIGHTK